MKRILTLGLAILMVLSLCACGGQKKESESQQNETSIILSDDLIDKIESRLTTNKTLGIVTEEAVILAKAKIRPSMYPTEKGYSYNKCEIKTYHQEDEYAIVANGFVYGTDEYGQAVKLKFTHTMTVVEDPDSEEGYKIVTKTDFEK